MIVKNYEKNEDNTARISVATDAAEFEAAVNGAYIKAKKNIAIPGFRKGKAPRKIVENMYGKEVFYQDALDELAQPCFDFAVAEKEIKFVGGPSIVDVNITEEPVAEFTFAVALYPEVELGQYKGLEVAVAPVVVTDEDVDAKVESVRKNNARMLSVDDRAAQMGDTVNIDFDGYLNGEQFEGGKAEGHELELGSGSFVPGFEDQIVGMQTGEEKDIDITFPEDYTAELAGKAVVFKVKVNEITVPELPELDDEFAKDVSEFDTLAEYKASVKEELTKQRQNAADAAKRNDVMQAAIDNMKVTVPAVMIDEKVKDVIYNYAANFGMNPSQYSFEQICSMMGLDKDTLATSVRPGAEFQVKSDLLVEAVAKAENLEPTEEELTAYVARLCEQTGAKEEELKNYFGEAYIKAELVKEQAQNLIVDSAVVTEKAE